MHEFAAAQIPAAPAEPPAAAPLTPAEPCLAETLWAALRAEAQTAAVREPVLAPLLEAHVLARGSLGEALAWRMADKFASRVLSADYLQHVFLAAAQDEPAIVARAARDIQAVSERDPASRGHLSPFLYFKGFHALVSHRFAHHLWLVGRTELALYLQSLASERLGVDIHPAARLGCGLMLDHATGIVIGETAVVENDCSLLQGVTLGGTGKDQGERHPKVRSGVLIGAGAKILGNIELGEGCWVGAGSVVLDNVPPHTTVVGVPARIVGAPRQPAPAKAMDQKVC